MHLHQRGTVVRISAHTHISYTTYASVLTRSALHTYIPLRQEQTQRMQDSRAKDACGACSIRCRIALSTANNTDIADYATSSETGGRPRSPFWTFTVQDPECEFDIGIGICVSLILHVVMTHRSAGIRPNLNLYLWLFSSLF